MSANRNRPRSIMVIGARGIPHVEGGAEKNAEALFPRVRASGYDVTLMGLATFIRSEEYKGVTLLAAPDIRTGKTDKIIYYLYAIFQVIRRRPDIVHLQGLGSAIFLLIYKMLGCRVVVRYGSADYILQKWGFLGKMGFRLSEWQLRFADAVISVAPSLSQRLEQRGIKRNVHLVPNALDVANGSRNEDCPDKYILMVGRVTAQKNVLNLINAFKIFRVNNPEFKLLIAGGLEDDKYVSQVRELLDESVNLLGKMPRDAVPNLLNSAALYVNLSFHEGHSNATMEAISHGVPILLSDIAENRDLGLVGGFHVDPNDPLQISRKMQQIISEPINNIAPTGMFLNWDTVSRKTIAIYDSLFERRVSA